MVANNAKGLRCLGCGRSNLSVAVMHLFVSASIQTFKKLPGWRCRHCSARMRLSQRFVIKLWLFALIFWGIAFPIILSINVSDRRIAFGIAFILGAVFQVVFLMIAGKLEAVLLVPNMYGKINFNEQDGPSPSKPVKNVQKGNKNKPDANINRWANLN